MPNRPNGWLRLWIVLSVLWVVAASLVQLPAVTRIYGQKAYEVAQSEAKLHELLDIIEQARAEHDAETEKRVTEAYRRATTERKTVIFSSAQSASDVEKIISTEIAPALLADKHFENPYDSYVKREGVRALRVMLVICLVPPIALLMLGWSFSWVRRGFTR